MAAEPTIILQQQQPDKKAPDEPGKQPAQDEQDLELRPASGRLLLAVCGALVAGIIMGVVVVRGGGKAEAPAAAESKPNDPNTVKLEDAQLSSVKMDKAAMQSFHGEHSTTGRIAFN